MPGSGILQNILGLTSVAFDNGSRSQVAHGEQWARALTVISPVMILEALVVMSASVKGAIDTTLA